MDTQYKYIERIAELYGILEDELSKEILLARLRFDITSSVDDALRLFGLTGMLTKEELAVQMAWRETFDKLNCNNQKIFLYGAGCCGRYAGDLILRSSSDFYGYCDKNEADFKEGVLGKPVVPPKYLFAHPEDCYVVISTMDYSTEIFQFLIENHFPEDHILPFFNKVGTSFSNLNEYFEFSELYPKGKAFIDGGCFDCGTSIQFASWSAGDYSKIIAFKPDEKNFQTCQVMLEHLGIERMELVQAGLSNITGTTVFAANNNGASSHISNREADGQCLVMPAREHEQFQMVQTVALDEKVGTCPVGFIKLDIEGAELSALHGAEKTILRDKPFLAVCVYHRRGDTVAIMDYLHTLVPEYRFWLRHYSPYGCDTVLYASI